MNLSEHLRTIIKLDKGINLSWVADKINMNEKTFSGKLKRDSLDAKDLLRIANVLNLDLNELRIKFMEEEGN